MPPGLGTAIVQLDRTTSILEGTMEPILFSDAELVADASDEELSIHTWRVAQLRRLGLSHALAETFAGLDWHEIEALVAHGCPPGLALEVAR
jgi:hypothetical protein